MRTRAEEPEQFQDAQLAAAAAMGPGVSNQALASGSPAALIELAKAAGGSQAVEALLANPGRSAEGLGRTGPHGSKPPSLRDGPPIHHLESEHVIPFAIGARLWELLSLVLPVRGRSEDRKQTTIMIYRGAAARKTKVDQKVIEQFKAEFAASGLAGDMSAEVAFAQGGGHVGEHGDGGPARAVLADMAAAIEEIRADAVERTVAAVAEENRAVEEGFDLSNGERRAVPPDREPDLPSADEIEAASETQYDDIIALAEKAVRKADR
ncbi:hypothetical protein [Virgisporangium aurantiacum]|uniref:Uncharacterized protein n=1 Tax=Virgisporangium aurantiacum TaxID=175570 RepID=A0A8J3Z0Q1_9ACTN|nr:hypothetical protein [Virgisporangium aurantiacum]GIJ55321.1 hypothetical protein Vau01_028370 [Virgisporangium aurantiacum]